VFGLRKYEADVYLALLQRSMATAQEVAENAAVPSPRIYSILKSLEQRGYVLKYQGSPARFRATNPGHILRAELSSLRRSVETLLLEAEQDYETSLQAKVQLENPATITLGQKGFMAAEIGCVSSSVSEIIGIVHDLDWCLEETVLHLLKKKRRNRVNIRMIGGDSSETRENLAILRASSGAEVRVVPPSSPSLKVPFLIRDRIELLVLVSGTNLSNPENTSAIITSNPEMAAMFRSTFEKIWSDAAQLEESSSGKN